MSKNESFPLIAIALFVLAAFLIGFGGINAVRAAPRIQSADYFAQVQLTNIHVVLVENGKVVEGDDTLLTDLLSREGDTELQVGKTYDELLCARNDEHESVGYDGEGINEYVRVTVYKYWSDADGNKRVDLDPNLIQLGFATADDGWHIDKAAETKERNVLYYEHVLPPAEEDNEESIAKATSTPFVKTIRIDPSAATLMNGGTFKYKDVKFNIKVTVDAVQTHNGPDAMRSAWGLAYDVDEDEGGQG